MRVLGVLARGETDPSQTRPKADENTLPTTNIAIFDPSPPFCILPIHYETHVFPVKNPPSLSSRSLTLAPLTKLPRIHFGNLSWMCFVPYRLSSIMIAA